MWLLLANGTVVGAEQVVFINRGEIHPGSSSARLNIWIPEQPLDRVVTNLVKLGDELLRTHLDNLDDSPLKAYATRIVRHKMEDMRNQVQDMDLEQTNSQKKRGLITMVTGTLLGLFGLATAEDGRQNKEWITKVSHEVKTEALRLNALNHRTEDLIQHYNKNQIMAVVRFRTLDEHVTRADTERTILASTMWYLDTTTRIEAQVRSITVGLHALAEGRLTTDILSQKDAALALLALEAKVAQQGDTLVSTAPMSLYRLKPRVTKVGDKFFATLEVPLYREDRKLELWEYVPIPLKVDHDTWAKPDTGEFQYLAVTKGLREEAKGIAMTRSQLDRCITLGGNMFCPEINLIDKFPDKTCLGSLYYRIWNSSKDTCKWTEASQNPRLIKASEGEITLFTTHPIKVAVKCGAEVKTTTFNTTTSMDTEPGCEVTTPYQWAVVPDTKTTTFEMRAIPEFAGPIAIEPKTKIPLTQMDIIRIRKITDIDIDALKLPETTHTNNILMWFPPGICLALFLGVLGAGLWAYRRAKSTSKPQQDEETPGSEGLGK